MTLVIIKKLDKFDKVLLVILALLLLIGLIIAQIGREERKITLIKEDMPVIARQETSRISVNRGEERNEPKSLGVYTITAYCPCAKCCGEYAKNRPGGVVYGAAGVKLIEGVSVAAWLPMGTEIMLDGHTYKVQDRTANWIKRKYDDKIIDIYMTSHKKALKFGKQQKEVFIQVD